MSTFTLAIPVWPLPICLDSWTWHSRFLCNLLFTASDLASITSHIHNWVLFLLWLHPFILSGIISPLISSSILGPYRPGEFPCQYPIILPFHTVHGVLKARILKWFAIPSSSGPYSVRPLHHDPSVLAGPTWHGLVSLSLTRLCSMLSDRLVVCDCGFSLSAFLCPLSVPTILLGFFLPWTWDFSSWLLQKSTATAPYLDVGPWDVGYCHTTTVPDLECGVDPHSRCSWPSTWGCSSGRSCAAQPWLLCCIAATPVWVGEDQNNNFSSFLMSSIPGWYNSRGLSMEDFLHISQHSGNLSIEILFPFSYALFHLAKELPVSSAVPWYVKTGDVPRPKNYLKYSDSIYTLPIYQRL